MRGRLTRWIGLGLMALAAGTMIAGDVLAAPGRAAVSSFTLRFDLFSPDDVSCAADAPRADVRASRSVFGSPYIRLTGDLNGATVTCTGPDGARFQTALPRDSRDPLAVDVEGVIVWRNGASRVPLLVRADKDRYSDYQRHSFTRLP